MNVNMQRFQARSSALRMEPSPKGVLPNTSLASKVLAAANDLPTPVSANAEKLDETQSLDEKLFDNAAQIKIAVSRIAMHLRPSWRDSLFEQIDSLLSPEQWEDDSAFLDLRSFTTFIRFIVHAEPNQLPALGVDVGGNVLAAWRSADRLVSVEYLSDDKAKAVLAKATARGKESASWHGPVAGLKNFIIAFGNADCLEAN